MATSRRPLRIAFALVFFIGLTSVGLALLTTRKSSKRSNRVSARDVALSSSRDPGGFFYKSLGRASTDPVDKDGSDAVRIATVSGFTVEFSAPTTDQRDAEKLVDSLKTKGITAYYTPLSDEGRIIYRVRKGIFPTEAQAAIEAKTLAKVLGREPQVVKLE